MSRLALAGVAVALGAVVVPSSASADGPRFVGTPTVTYAGTTVSVVVRLDRALADRSSSGFVVAPALQAGDTIGAAYGGVTPGRIGSPSRHCYTAEAIQLVPRAKLRANAHWRIGFVTKDERVLHTHAITLRRAPTANYGEVERAAARRLGCYES